MRTEGRAGHKWSTSSAHHPPFRRLRTWCTCISLHYQSHYILDSLACCSMVVLKYSEAMNETSTCGATRWRFGDLSFDSGQGKVVFLHWDRERDGLFPSWSQQPITCTSASPPDCTAAPVVFPLFPHMLSCSFPKDQTFINLL